MIKSITDRINGFGVLLRFVTPALLALSIFILTDIQNEVCEVNEHFKNHLMHHQDLEVGYAGRLATIETKLDIQ